MANVYNLGDMEARIVSETLRTDLGSNNVTLTLSSVRLAVRDAIAEYQREHFYFNEVAYETWASVADQEFYTEGSGGVPSDLIEIVSLSVVYSSNRYPLRRRTWGEIEAIQSGAVTGSVASDYAYFGAQFRMYPIPDSANQTYSLAYIERIAAPTSVVVRTNAWMNEAEELIRCAAKRRIYQHVLAMPEDALSMAQAEAAALKKLRAETNAKLRTGRIKVRPF